MSGGSILGSKAASGSQTMSAEVKVFLQFRPQEVAYFAYADWSCAAATRSD